MVKFGNYDQKVKFKTYQDQSDGFGGSIPSYVEVLSTYASISVKSVSHLTEGGSLELSKYYEIRVQYRAGFVPNESMRIEYKDKELQINGVRENDERRRREYIIMAVSIN